MATSAAAAPSGTLNASGSTLQLAFEQAAIQAFKKVDPKITVNYGGGGSGKGRTDLTSGVVQFAGSDSPFSADELPALKGRKVLYFPILIGPISVSYHLSGVNNLRLSPATVAKIFQAKITKWNDPAIKADNPGVNLPNMTITVAHRSDSSGTTQNFAAFLQESVPNIWKLGDGSTVNWPASTRGGNGNGGVAQIISSTNGAIGYVDLADAVSAHLTYAAIKNKAGKYIKPTVKTATAAADKAKLAKNLTFSAVWAPGANSYPITAQSWVLVYQKQPNQNTAKLLQSYIGYLVGSGQKLLAPINYAPLPKNMDNKAKAQLKQISG